MAAKRFIWTADRLEKLEEYAGDLRADQIADIMGVDQETFLTALRNSKKAATTFTKARAMKQLQVAKALRAQAMNGDIKAAKVYLQSVAGWRPNNPLPDDDLLGDS